MATPKTVGRFYVETSRRTTKNAESTQNAVLSYMDELAAIGRASFAHWSSAQQANLQTAFQLQNTAIQAAQDVLDASTRASFLLFDEWVKVVADGQAALAEVAATGVSVLDNGMRPLD